MAMFMQVEHLATADGARLALRHEPARIPARGIVFILHGLAEHSARYDRFAQWLAHEGFHAVAHDHRGHGLTRVPGLAPRRFAHAGGDRLCASDARAVRLHMRERVERADGRRLPVIVFGHSMGGLIAADIAAQDGAELAGVALWNCDPAAGWKNRLARLILRAERGLKGSDVASLAFRRATFDLWRASVPGRQTDYDWLSHDAAQVAAYAGDPLCGWTPTNSMAMDIVALVERAGHGTALAAWPADLPVHLLGGGADPVTQGGRAIDVLGNRLRAAGLTRVDSLVIPTARHETLNEIPAIRDPALAALDAWLSRVAPPQRLAA
ncbi:alpha/beta fold hydrolase [Aureimonas frigidaquae]|uniref:alpha/beta fold hydrolase n=1 Tax=Aureimonas frigidaquae TaxID=424757 RepID=UPI00178CEECC|nr:alpha/beta hydrolase [Aureimonas frigidaquae]